MLKRLVRSTATRLLKPVVRAVYLRTGTSRRIMFGPLRGMIYRVGPITGLAAWYSGAERELQRRFRELVKPGDCVIDAGANWGVHTLYLSRLVGPHGRVIAVECYPPALAELTWHVEANGCANVRIVQAALSEGDGQAVFVQGDSASEGKLLIRGVTPTGAKEAVVKTRSLDSLLDELSTPRPALIKIDVEGAEGRVLSGAERVTMLQRPLFLIELHNPEQDLFVAQWLTTRGYTLERLKPPPILYVDRSWPAPNGVWGTIIARPK